MPRLPERSKNIRSLIPFDPKDVRTLVALVSRVVVAPPSYEMPKRFPLIVDTRNAVSGDHAHVLKLGAPAPPLVPAENRVDAAA